LREGHWVKVKGVYLGGGDFRASELAVAEPEDEEEIVGIVDRVIPGRDRFRINGQLVSTSHKTEWRDLSLAALKGQMIKVQGHYRGPGKFSARDIRPRKAGRSGLEGRVDHLQLTADGMEILVFNVRVLIAPDVEIEIESGEDLEKIPLAPLRHNPASPEYRFFDDRDDAIPGTLRITDTLRVGALFELKSAHEDNFNLNDDKPRDRTDYRASVNAEMRWFPNDSFTGLVRGRASYRYRQDQGDGSRSDSNTRLSEAWGNWHGIMGSGFSLQFGRQDFDERREWLYDQNLDALRLVWSNSSLKAELSMSTTLSSGSDRDMHSTNYIAYVSNNDERQHIGAYVIDRRDGRAPRDYPIHFGVRAHGRWLPDNKLWAELSTLRGYSNNVDLEGWAFDLGTTWSPGFIDPFYVTVGFAQATGDDPSTPNVNEAFRQTGFQDNNDKFGGVTSFRYYGELVDPELSNLGILTMGMGVRPTRNSSIDLVYHDYSLSELTTHLPGVEIRRQPDGVHKQYGREYDLVFGARQLSGFDVEVVAGCFVPGAALSGADSAWLLATQIRYRF